MELSVKLTSCKYCGSQFDGKSDFCCQACELLFQVDYKSWVPSVGQQNLLKAKKNEYMDSEEFKSFYRNAVDEFDFTFYVEGLQCSSCIHLLEKIPEFTDQVKSIEVNFSLSLIRIQSQPHFKMSQFIALVDELGYKASPISKTENLAEKYKLENRKNIKRIAIAGACTGNIMLFVVPVYGGLSGSYATAFNWLSFILFLPIVFYSAIPFYTGAWNSLRYRVINVDLPIVIALWTGFIFSTVNLIQGKSGIYYDSTASFLFLILATRFFVKRIQQKTLSESSILNFIPLQIVEYKTESGIKKKISTNLKVGDTLVIQANQILPADGVLYSISADLDNSLLSGESLPQTLTQGMKVYAGTRCLNRAFEMTVEKTDLDTEIGQIVSRLEKESLKKTSFVTFSEATAQWLIATVFAIAVVFFVVYGSLNNYDEALNRVLALIVIACPCALAFGTPLTYALSLRKARDLGILIKNGNVFEKVTQIKNIFFDKTGTLTSGQLTLVNSFPPTIHTEWKEIILGLESNSTHPLAFAFRKVWTDTKPAVINDLEEIIGSGVRGHFQGSTYALESSHSREESGLISVCFKKNSQTLGYFYFSDELHSDTKLVIQTLRTHGFEMGIVSGDKILVVDKIANDVGLPGDLVFAEKKPHEKMEIIQGFDHVCMIGDGANDALALKAAHVGISVKGSVTLSHNSSDICFTRPGLKSLIDLIKISQRSQRILKTNLAFALLYNFIGGSLALMGFINPLVAAVLMPISSLLIALNSYWGLK